MTIVPDNPDQLAARLDVLADMWQDEAPFSRGDVVPSLGMLLDWLLAKWTADRERANEAARLAADAQDKAEHLVNVVGDLRVRLASMTDERDDLSIEVDRLRGRDADA